MTDSYVLEVVEVVDETANVGEYASIALGSDSPFLYQSARSFSPCIISTVLLPFEFAPHLWQYW